MIEPVKTVSTGRALGKKLRRIGHPEGYAVVGLGHWCPACGVMHAFPTDGHLLGRDRWIWNGAIAKPTFEPDRDLIWKGFGGLVRGGRCHYRLENGIIRFLADCSHRLRDRSIELPDLPGHLTD